MLDLFGTIYILAMVAIGTWTTVGWLCDRIDCRRDHKIAEIRNAARSNGSAHSVESRQSLETQARLDGTRDA